MPVALNYSFYVFSEHCESVNCISSVHLNVMFEGNRKFHQIMPSGSSGRLWRVTLVYVNASHAEKALRWCEEQTSVTRRVCGQVGLGPLLQRES